MYLNSIFTDQSVIVVFTNGTKVVQSSNPVYDDVVNAIRTGSTDAVEELVDFASKIKRHSSGRFYVVDGAVYLDGEILPEQLSIRVLQFVNQGVDTTPLIKFWRNLKQNPSNASRQDLYGFLEHNNIPVTQDGCFIAYKRVRDDFKDCHSGVYNNRPGSVVEMPREDVDPDNNRTCSAGLHVAAYNYANNFYANGNLIEVKVNPRDVVAVPKDYNNEKMRVCEYKVVRLCQGPREEVFYDLDLFADDEWDDELYEDVEAWPIYVVPKSPSFLPIDAACVRFDSPNSYGDYINKFGIRISGLHPQCIYENLGFDYEVFETLNDALSYYLSL